MKYRMKVYVSNTREVLLQETEENLEVASAFDELAFHLLQSRQENQALREEEIHRILLATEFAAERHHKQTRRNVEKTPYIIHPLHVTTHLLTIGHIYDADVLMAALLHDTVEDTETTLEDLRKIFGYRVERLVEELSDDKNLSKEERKRMQIQNAPHKSPQATWIILADKLSNLKDLMEYPPVGWDKERVSNYFLWAQEVIKHLPPSHAELMNVVEEIIQRYWQRLANQEYKN